MNESAIRYSRDLKLSFPRAVWPQGISLRGFAPGRAREVHALLIDAYRSGGGSVPSFSQWWSEVAGDAEYDPAFVRLACSHDGTPVGVAQCWASGFVKDLGVARSWQSKGVGRALMLNVFAVFAARGIGHVDLKVQATNARAIAFYEGLGMTRVSTP